MLPPYHGRKQLFTQAMSTPSMMTPIISSTSSRVMPASFATSTAETSISFTSSKLRAGSDMLHDWKGPSMVSLIFFFSSLMIWRSWL